MNSTDMRPGRAVADLSLRRCAGHVAPALRLAYTAPEQMQIRFRRQAVTGITVLILSLAALACDATSIKVVGRGMEPTLTDGESLIGSPVDAIDRGDIVGFRDPRDESKSYVMRVTGLPGERILSRGGHAVIDGAILEEPYLVRPATRNQNWGPVDIPGDGYFLMGDHRDDSFDSRSFGGVPREAIWTKVWLPRQPSPRLQAADTAPFVPSGPVEAYGCDTADGGACAEGPGDNAWETAAARGVSFRGIGQEPGWFLEIIPGRWIHFAYDYAQQHAFTPVPAPVRAAGRLTWRAETEAHTLEVVVEERPCQDAMSGQPYEATVTVTLDDNTYRGCGRAIG